MPVINIDNIEDPRLDVYRSLKLTNRTRREKLFVVEGATVTHRLLASDYSVQSLVVIESRLHEVVDAVHESIDLFVLSKAQVSQLVGFKFHLGVLAAAQRRATKSLAEVLPETGSSLVLFGDHITDQQNVGMMIRVASAFGADAVVFGPGSADPFSRRVTRVSMGNGFFIPVVASVDAIESIRQLQNLKYATAATVLEKTAVEISDHQFADRTAIVVGNETHGISPDILEACDQRLTISMLNGTDSVNVAIATGIFAHAYRSRK
ncbi:MAG: RNA methyltransferase [Planctomycetales bacterium]|nr:RNA methyltransferase [Planctomycetales bacterium]